MRWLPQLLSAILCLSTWGVTFAQSPAAGPDAGQLAEAALGQLPGVVSVGVLRDGKIQVAVRRRERLGQPVEKVDGPAPGAEPIFEIGSVSKVIGSHPWQRETEGRSSPRRARGEHTASMSQHDALDVGEAGNPSTNAAWILG